MKRNGEIFQAIYRLTGVLTMRICNVFMSYGACAVFNGIQVRRCYRCNEYNQIKTDHADWDINNCKAYIKAKLLQQQLENLTDSSIQKKPVYFKRSYLLTNKNKILKIYCQNTRGLRCKVSDFYLYLS